MVYAGFPILNFKILGFIEAKTLAKRLVLGHGTYTTREVGEEGRKK